jgi:hypothetical protein
MKPSTPSRAPDRSLLEVKVLLTVASVAAMVGGWAWLTLGEERGLPAAEVRPVSTTSEPIPVAVTGTSPPPPRVRAVRAVRRPRPVTFTRSSR